MGNIKKKYSSKVGLPPGSLVYVGDHKSFDSVISKMEFSTDAFNEIKPIKVDQCKIPVDHSSTTWFDIHGIHNTDLISKFGKNFSLENLALEDVVNTTSRPKVEDFGNYLYLSFKILELDNNKNHLVSKQLSLILGKNWLLSFHETTDDLFENFRNRIRQSLGIVRTRKEDYIFYRLLDTVIDNYFLVTEHINSNIETLEEKILREPDQVSSQEIYNLKKIIGEMKKVVVPVREAVSSILRMDTELISDGTEKFFRDVYEHIIQIIETIDQQREMVNDFINLYMTALSNKMNQVMKVLTIFASIFIPLTFIAGIYGMNFKVMPELEWEYGYFIVWGIMLIVTIALLFYFKRKRWL